MIKCRKAKCADTDTIIGLRMYYLDETHPEMDDTTAARIRSQLPGYFQEHLNRDVEVYLAEDGDKAVGCVFFVMINKPASPLFITGKTATLMNVLVLPEYRRRGIARTLLDMAIEDGKSLDLSYIELRSTECGYPLYKNAGFTEDKSIYMSMKLFLN